MRDKCTDIVVLIRECTVLKCNVSGFQFCALAAEGKEENVRRGEVFFQEDSATFSQMFGCN
jgi:hypothetical protein